jgi:hypothetical protein
MRSIGGMTLTWENRRTRWKTCPIATWFTADFVWTGLVSNLGFRGERSVTNRPSLSIANTVLENMWKETVMAFFEDTVLRFSLIVGKINVEGSNICMSRTAFRIWDLRGVLWHVWKREDRRSRKNNQKKYTLRDGKAGWNVCTQVFFVRAWYYLKTTVIT